MNAKLDLMLLLLCLFFCSFPHLPLSFHLPTELDCVLTTYQILSQGLDTPRRSELLESQCSLLLLELDYFLFFSLKMNHYKKFPKSKRYIKKRVFQLLCLCFKAGVASGFKSSESTNPTCQIELELFDVYRYLKLGK